MTREPITKDQWIAWHRQVVDGFEKQGLCQEADTVRLKIIQLETEEGTLEEIDKLEIEVEVRRLGFVLEEKLFRLAIEDLETKIEAHRRIKILKAEIAKREKQMGEGE